MFINMPGEDYHAQVLTDDMFIDGIIGNTGNDISDNEDNERYQAPRRSEMLRAISALKQFALIRDLLSSSFHTGLCTL